jgi:hypothetical protein
MKSGQIRESHAPRRSKSTSAQSPLTSSVSPPTRSSDYDSESSSQKSSNTIKHAHCSLTNQEHVVAEEPAFNCQAGPMSVYSFDDHDSNLGDESFWMQVQQRQEDFVHPHPQLFAPQNSHLDCGRIAPSSHHFGAWASGCDMEFSDEPILYSRPIDAASYNF